MQNKASTKSEDIGNNRLEQFNEALCVVTAIGDFESIQAKYVQLITKSLSMIADYHIEKGTNLEQAQLARRALNELQEKTKMTRANLIALLTDHLGVLDNVELRDYNKEKAAD
ncbi:MAG: hypothetical protein MHMPM18_003915 [Marteilia pararefringens]